MTIAPKISVVIPVYKVENFLDRCVQSVINQTLQDIEIILVDDESPDSCPQMCDEYAKQDNRIKVVHKKNEGLGFARNSGLDVAKGEYVTFLDSDDFVELNAYEILYNEACTNQLDICYFQHCRYLDNGTKIYKKNLVEEVEYIETNNDVQKFLLNMVGAHPTERKPRDYSMSVCMGIFKLDIIKNCNIRFVSEREIASEDLIFHLNLLPRIRKIGILPNVFYNYYINPESITTTYNEQKYLRLIKCIDVVKEFLDRSFEYSTYHGHYYSQILRIYKVILKFESLNENTSKADKKKRIAEICSHSQLTELYTDKIVNKYPLRERLFIFCMKHRISSFFLITYKCRTKLK